MVGASKRVKLARSLSSLRLFPHFKRRIIEALSVSRVFSENYLRSRRGRCFEDHKGPQECEERLLWRGWSYVARAGGGTGLGPLTLGL